MVEKNEVYSSKIVAVITYLREIKRHVQVGTTTRAKTALYDIDDQQYDNLLDEIEKKLSSDTAFGKRSENTLIKILKRVIELNPDFIDHGGINFLEQLGKKSLMRRKKHKKKRTMKPKRKITKKPKRKITKKPMRKITKKPKRKITKKLSKSKKLSKKK